MSTKLVDKIVLDKEDLLDEVRAAWRYFLGDSGLKTSKISHIIESCYAVVSLHNTRWFEMTDGSIFDMAVNGCWLGLDKVGQTYIDLNRFQKNMIPKGYDLPTVDEVSRLRDIRDAQSNVPFALKDYRPADMRCIFCKKEGVVTCIWMDHYFPKNCTNISPLIPIRRLDTAGSDLKNKKKIFLLWITHGLTPKWLEDNENYKFLLHFKYTRLDGDFHFKIDFDKDISEVPLESSSLVQELLYEDKIRADIKEYNGKMLEDIEQGHWSLWDRDDIKEESKIVVSLENEKLVARDPISSIKDGVVGIDFGTKSTVVVYQEDTTKIHPMRIGTGDLSKTVSKNHYENPTIMEFNNIENFIHEYQKTVARPHTKWSDITISHTAINSLLSSKSEDYNSYFSELKQWAGNRNKRLKIVDKNDNVTDLPTFIELKDEFNPIEIYAYYLGLYINNQHNGIFLNYILSFPVTYELEIRDKIIESFYKGIKKSLPIQLHKPEILEKLNVQKGASEPAAYAVVALQEYGFKPSGDEKVFYGIFDFGGGTTDFDFGIWREANGAKEGRYDYVIEHFGAGGDRYLGGENLLELLAFELFKANKEILLTNQIQFILPPECEKFLGSEVLLSQSQEARMNTKTLMEKLRPLWEQQEDRLKEFEGGVLGVNLTNIDAKQFANFELSIDKNILMSIIETRVKRGVVNFFESLRLAFNNKNIDFYNINQINIFLAGNSSKSKIVTKLFDEEIAKVKEEIKNLFQTQSDDFFKIYPPLGGNNVDLEKPNGKTGVAFGLIEARKSGSILVKDHNIGEDISFKYYLGVNKKKKFKTLISRETAYNEWILFIDAIEKTFELFYTMQPLASTNNVDIGDSSIKKMILSIDKTDESAFVFIRVIEPAVFEYVVAYENEIKTQKYLSKIEKVVI